MIKNDRQNEIRVKLVKDKKVYVCELAKELQVTTRTIRNDLKELSSRAICVPFHGGASLVQVAEESLFDKSVINTILRGLGQNSVDPAIIPLPKERLLDGGIYILGSFNVDIVSETLMLPRIGQTIRSSSTHFYAGGKGTNQAVAAAKLNNNVHLAIKLGMDEFSEKARKYIANTEISSFTIFENEIASTGIALVWVSHATGDNMITIDLGANETFTQEDILFDLDIIKKCKLFLTQLENNFSITRFAIMQAKSFHALVLVNPAPYVSEVKDILHLIDIITPNKVEAEALSGRVITDIDSAKSAAQCIHQQGAKCVIITLGGQGCLLFDGLIFTYIPAYKSAVVDTSGAGDAFTGALAACIANGKALIDSVQYACAFASLKVERKGASNMPNSSLVYHRMQQQ